MSKHNNVLKDDKCFQETKNIKNLKFYLKRFRALSRSSKKSISIQGNSETST